MRTFRPLCTADFMPRGEYCEFKRLIFSARRAIISLHYRVKKEDTTMSRVISDACISCGTCEGECPVGAISMGSDHFQVNEDTCIDCGACESACPVGAISEK